MSTSCKEVEERLPDFATAFELRGYRHGDLEGARNQGGDRGIGLQLEYTKVKTLPQADYFHNASRSLGEVVIYFYICLCRVAASQV